MKWIAFSSLLVLAAGANATLYFDRATFLTDPLATGLVNEDFEGFALGTDLQGAQVGNAKLGAPGVQTLLVQDTGVRFAPNPSSGKNMISPGGIDKSQEDDDLTITFLNPVDAAGIDICFDAPDGASFVSVTFVDVNGAAVESNGFIPCPNGAPGYQFVGATSATQIKLILIDEYDGSPDDDHVMYDSLVYSSVPEPATMALLGLPLLAYLKRRTAKI